jgi:hypothetical protein
MDSLCSHLSPILAGFIEQGAIVTNICSDNAANMVGAVRAMAKDMAAFQSTCACHVIHIVVRLFVEHYSKLNDVISRARAAAIPGIPSIPYDQDTRWNNKYDQFKIIANNWEKLVVEELVDHETGRACFDFFANVLVFFFFFCEAENVLTTYLRDVRMQVMTG